MKLVLLDRDGVINFDSAEFVKAPDEWRPIPGSLEAIARLNKAGIKVAVVSNQSGIGRQLFDLDTLDAIHRKLTRLLQTIGGHIDAFYFCPHHPEEGCQCRKPKPHMAIKAMHDFHCTPEQTIFIGDSYRDLQSAMTAHCTPALVLTGNGKKTQEKHELNDIAIYQDLADFVNQLDLK